MSPTIIQLLDTPVIQRETRKKGRPDTLQSLRSVNYGPINFQQNDVNFN